MLNIGECFLYLILNLVPNWHWVLFLIWNLIVMYCLYDGMLYMCCMMFLFLFAVIWDGGDECSLTNSLSALLRFFCFSCSWRVERFKVNIIYCSDFCIWTKKQFLVLYWMIWIHMQTIFFTMRSAFITNIHMLTVFNHFCVKREFWHHIYNRSLCHTWPV